MDDLYITQMKSAFATPGNTETFVIFGNFGTVMVPDGGWYVALYWDRAKDQYQVWSVNTHSDFYPTLKQAEDYILGYLAAKKVI